MSPKKAFINFSSDKIKAQTFWIIIFYFIKYFTWEQSSDNQEQFSAAVFLLYNLRSLIV